MKIFVISKRTGILYALLFIMLISLIYIGKTDSLTVSSQQRDLPIYCVQKPETEKVISISFDAAWGAPNLRKLPAKKILTLVLFCCLQKYLLKL